MTDCNFFCKILSAIIIVVAFIVNTVGGWFGADGDIIPTDQACILHPTTAVESSADISTEEFTTIPETTTATATTSTTITSTTTPTVTETTTTTTKVYVSTTQPPETDAGPHIVGAEELSLSVLSGSDSAGSEDVVIRGIAALANGDYVVCGTTSSKVGDMASVYTSGWKLPYSFVARYSGAGNRKWIKGFGSTSGTVSLEDIAVISDGTVIAVGSSDAKDYASGNAAGSADAIVLKLASNNGYLRSKKAFGGNKSDMFNCVCATADGFVVGGKSYSSTGDFASLKGAGAVIMNFDADAKNLWQKSLVGDAASTISDIAVDGNGNIFASCQTSTATGDFAQFDKLQGGYTDSLALKYDSDGNLKWGYVISSSGRDEFSSIAPDGKGGCVIAGYYELMPSPIPDGTLTGVFHCGKVDSLVIRVNANGTQRWVKPLSGFENDYITDIIQTDGGFAVTGYTTSSNREFAGVGNMGGYDGYISFLNTNGVTVNTYSQAGTNDDMAECAVYASNGNIICAGRTKSLDLDFKDKNNFSSSVYSGYMSIYSITVE